MILTKRYRKEQYYPLIDSISLNSFHIKNNRISIECSILPRFPIFTVLNPVPTSVSARYLVAPRKNRVSVLSRRSRGTFSSKMNRVPKAFRKNFASAAGFQRLVLRRNCKWIGSWNMSAQFAGVCCLWALGAVPSYSLVSRLELSPRPLFPPYFPCLPLSLSHRSALVLALTEIYAASRVNSAWLAVHRCSTVYTWVERIVCRRHGEPCLENLRLISGTRFYNYDNLFCLFSMMHWKCIRGWPNLH